LKESKNAEFIFDVLGSILSTFYAHIIYTKVLCTAFSSDISAV